MNSKNIWESTRSLLVAFNYENDEQLKDFRKSLDGMLNASNVDRLIIVVSVPKEVDKNTLPPHFLIYYNSPTDFNFWSKLKDVQLETELQRNYDLMIWFGNTESKIFPYVQEASIRRKIIVNEKDASFDLQLNAESELPSEMLQFVIDTLKKITSNE
ncbi:MAG: hypothetical protein NWR96_08280 [Crocinitomicaceae bacterium]|nr:hypothetical protein [Crocinitomicaceae bacterium]MDP4761617.1 hypothetical protein [Crocinitomicaceae bacterium]